MECSEGSKNLIMKKKRLIETVSNLTPTEYMEIFNIFIEDKCQYSENLNGVFINLNNVTEETIDKINSFINFIKDKNNDLITRDETIKNLKDNYIKEDDTIDNFVVEINRTNENKNETIEYEDNNYEQNKIKAESYLDLSSDEDENLENKLSLKKKKVKQTGKKAKIINSYKNNKPKNNNKDDSE
jgi:hypothetical protein